MFESFSDTLVLFSAKLCSVFWRKKCQDSLRLDKKHYIVGEV